MEITTYEQFKEDGEKGMHNADYLLKHFANIGSVCSIKESIEDDRYSLFIIETSTNDVLIDTDCHVDARLDIGLSFLGSFYEYYKKKPSLELVK